MTQTLDLNQMELGSLSNLEMQEIEGGGNFGGDTMQETSIAIAVDYEWV